MLGKSKKQFSQTVMNPMVESEKNHLKNKSKFTIGFMYPRWFKKPDPRTNAGHTVDASKLLRSNFSFTVVLPYTFRFQTKNPKLVGG